MSKFHSTISRRDFMKGLGLAGAGLGAAAATAPVFHDLDEVTSTASIGHGYPWWVKERDFENVTTEVDWDVYERYDGSKHPMPFIFGPGAMFGPDESERRRQLYQRWFTNKTPGSTLRDFGLEQANRDGLFPGANKGNCPWNGPAAFPLEQWGATAWEGTPEENLQTCRAAMRMFGSPKVGAIELNDHTSRFFNAVGTPIWEDIEVGFQDENKAYHIPNKCKYLLTWITVQNYMQSTYAVNTDKDDPDYGLRFLQGACAETQAYSHAGQILFQIAKFIKTIGYQVYTVRTASNTQFGVFSGLNEQGRVGYSTTPEYGNSIRTIAFLVTDFPLAPTKPIDAGIRTFCKDCARCADTCPTGSVADAKEPSWEVRDPGNNPGIKTWFQGWSVCAAFGGPMECMNCQSICPFNHPNNAIVHPIVRGTIGTTSIFNSFFANMDEFMGYGRTSTPEERLDWWDRDPSTYGYDTILGAGRMYEYV